MADGDIVLAIGYSLETNGSPSNFKGQDTRQAGIWLNKQDIVKLAPSLLKARDNNSLKIQTEIHANKYYYKDKYTYDLNQILNCENIFNGEFEEAETQLGVELLTAEDRAVAKDTMITGFFHPRSLLAS